MPHYYFSTKHGTQHTDFGEALELKNDRAAWEEATIACGEILKDIDGKLKPNQEWRMDVKNEGRAVIFSLRLIPETNQPLETQE